MLRKKLSIPLLISILLISCSKDEDNILPSSQYNENLITYFKIVALGFEFGNASKVTRKWNSEMKIFVGGEQKPELLSELESIKNEINELATDGFKISIVNDSLQSNYYIFFGSRNEYADIFPRVSSLVDTNWGLFSVFWNNRDEIFTGYMYVDIIRSNLTEQKHLLREELTQSLGLAKDSPLYDNSIFQTEWTTTTAYATIDKDLIRLLYHPQMRVSLNENEVDIILRNILD